MSLIGEDVRHLIAEKSITLTEREAIGYLAGAILLGAGGMLALIWLLAQ